MIHIQTSSLINAFLSLFKLLPAEAQEKIKEELTLEKSRRKALPKNEQKQKNEFREFLLSAPEMTDEQFNYIQEKRQHFNKWK